MARLTSPKRTVSAIFIRSVVEGKESFLREPYNIVALDFGDGSPINTFVEPICGRPLSPFERGEVYDEVRFYSAPLFANSQIGYVR